MPGRPARVSRRDDARLRLALCAMLRERGAGLAAELAGALRSVPVERVHRARVAARSLRSILGTLDGALDPALAERVGEDLRAVGKALGPIREADVRRAWLLELAEETALPAARRRALEAALRRDCAAARRAFRAHARSPEFAARRDRLEAALGDRRLVTGRDDLRPWLVRRLRRRWRRLLRKLDAGEADADALHALRLRGKHARYATEALLPLLGADPAPAVRPLKKLQACLGDHRDAQDALAWLESLPEPARSALLERLRAPIRRRMKARLRQFRRLRHTLAVPKSLAALREAAAGAQPR